MTGVHEGNVITIAGVPGTWRVCETTADGRTRLRPVDESGNPGTFEPFIWQDGNFGCDCNRAVFFAPARQEPGPEETPCGETRYRIDRIVRVSDGQVVYREETGS